MIDNNNFWIELEKTWFYASEGEETLVQKYDIVGFAVFSILKRNITTRNTFPICINAIADVLQINKNKNTSFMNKIKKAIINMNGNDKLFVLCEDTNCNKSIDATKINNSTTYYAKLTTQHRSDAFMMIYDSEIDKLIEHAKDKKVSVNDLITNYCFIINGLKGKKKDEEVSEGYRCWYGTYESITKKIGLVKNTLVSNNKIFQELNLLLIGNAGGKVEGDKYENTSNIYAKVEDKEYFDKYLEVKKGQINRAFQRDKDKAQQDEQRRLKQLYKTYQKKHEIDNVNDCTDEEYEELQQLELAYLNYVKSRDKEPKNANFKTIKRDGAPIRKYVPEDDEIDINELENEVPEGYETNAINDNGDDNWGGEPAPNIDIDDDEEFVEEDIRENLKKYIYSQCKISESIKAKFMEKFQGTRLKTLKGKDLLQFKTKVEFFFNKAEYLDF